MKTLHNVFAASVTALLLTVAARSGRAQSCSTITSVETSAFNAIHCSSSYFQSFVPWADNWFNVTDNSWNANGRNGPVCDNTTGYIRAMTGLWYLENGQADWFYGWHPSSVYRNHSYATTGWQHEPVRLRYVPGTVATMERTEYNIGIDFIDFGCQAFSDGNGPAERAAALVHESHHDWAYTNEGDDTNSQTHSWPTVGGHCSNGDLSPSCDTYYPHGRFAWIGHDLTYTGWMPAPNADIQMTHSAYQVGAEVLCDFYTNPRAGMPLAVQNQSRDGANVMLGQNFNNAVFWKCGTPKPFVVR